MAVQDFNTTFGRNAFKGAPQAGSKGQDERPKAQYWLNIGYSVDIERTVDGKQETEQRFISLPTGIPLDSQELLPTNSRNQEYAAFMAARNDLHSQIMEVAKTLAAGEERTLNLQIQLRRVNEDAPAIENDANPFVKKIALV